MYRTTAQIDFVGALIASFYPSVCTRIDLPEASVQGRPVYAYRLRGGSGPQRRGVLLVGGTHARELMNPDMLIELLVDLVASYKGNRDIVLGGKTWTARDVQVMLDALDVYILPCVNPDGREHVLAGDKLWRKNRRDNPGTPCDGVDLNRNADVLWGVTAGQTSCNPCAETYVGPGAFSEPETRNVRWLLDTYRVDTFVDVHSYSELVLYPWGHAPSQTTDPSKRFTTLPTGTCQPIGTPGYAEYIEPRDLARFEGVAQRIVEAVAAVRGRTYVPEPGFGLYGTTGTLGDYAYARHIASPGSRKTYGFTMETGPWMGSVLASFQPADPEPVKDEAESGVLALIQQTICAIELIGANVLGRSREVDALRRVRDEVLATTPAGRAWIDLFEGLQAPLVTAAMTDERLRDGAGELVTLAAGLVAEPDAVLEPRTAERALALLRELDGALLSRRVSAGIRAAAGRLERAAGRSADDLLRDLVTAGPDERGAAG
jgi:murein tripeptide amidase MpaA